MTAANDIDAPRCRHCESPLTVSVVDLGHSPLANDYAPPDSTEPEESHELHARLCTECNLVQVRDAVTPQRLFGDYAYFSSYSASWLAHAEKFAIGAMSRLDLRPGDLVVEIASNDGYLLKNFVAAGIDVLGVEPAANIAEVARAAGIPTEGAFFGEEVARDLRSRGLAPRLVVGNNVFAHVPDINDFAAGLAVLVGDHGVVSLEFPHLARMIAETQFDTIYHEHFSYISLAAAERVLGSVGLEVVDVEELATHGGSLRVWAASRGVHPVEASVAAIRHMEREAGLSEPATYAAFADRVERIRRDFTAFVRDANAAGRTVAAYGAAAKGNTLLNHCGLTSDDIVLVADASPHKQGLTLPGSGIPIAGPDELLALAPDHVVILPWNLQQEIRHQLAPMAETGTTFVVAVPELTEFR